MDRASAGKDTGNAGPVFRILHVLRAPVGGLFRHVNDLAREQIARGHHVGLVTDLTTGGEKAAEALAQLEPALALGLLRLPMRRQPSLSDLTTALKIRRHAEDLAVDVIHGHGAKGGLYARFPAPRSRFAPLRAYTPHGGSFGMTMPYPLQRFYMLIERLINPFTDAYLFESFFVAGRFAEHIGKTKAVTEIIPNGIGKAEFAPVQPLPDAADLIFVGEIRRQKGLRLLIDALARLNSRSGRKLRLILVGNGADKAAFIQYVATLGLNDQISFLDAMPAREAFKHGRILVLPSRSESLPYIILEAAGAELPIVATNVGDIGRVLAPFAHRLVPPNDLERLVQALTAMLETPLAERQRDAAAIATLVAERFTITKMVDSVLAVYAEAMARKSAQHGSSKPSFTLHS